MTLPTAEDWLFSAKLTAATLLALGIALWVDLPRPYWAMSTVFITGQLFVGATNAKARFRIYGTIIGSTAAVILVPNLVNAPELLTLAIAIWVAICLYFSLLDRTPRSYTMMLSGYTAAFVGFPTVAAPDAIFDVAVSRAEEITLGVLCATFVMSVALPRHACPIVAARLDKWFVDVFAWSRSVFGRFKSRDDRRTRLQLACGVIGFDSLITALQHELIGAGRSAEALAKLRQHMLLLILAVASIADRIKALEAVNAMPDYIRSKLDALVLKTAITANEQEFLDCSILDASRFSAARSDWERLLTESLLLRLGMFHDLVRDIQILRGHVRDGFPITEELAFKYSETARDARHRDHTMAALSAVGALFAILTAGAVWIATGWPDGSAAPMMAAVGCSFFAIQDNPVPQIMDLARAGIFGAIGAGLYLFALLPVATNFEMLGLLLCPALLFCGLLMMQPRFALLGMGSIVIGSTLLALQSSYTGEFSSFINLAIAVVFGLWTAAVVTRLFRSVGAVWSARRLRRLNREALAHVANRDQSTSAEELSVVMLDRLGLLAPRLAALPPQDSEWTGELLSEVQVGAALIEIVDAMAELGLHGCDIIQELLGKLRQYFSGEMAHAPDVLLSAIDAALLLVSDLSEDSSAKRRGQLGLTDLRLGLFLNATPYRSTRAVLATPEVAA